MAEDAVDRKIATLINEGKPRDQAVAIAKSMERRGDLKSPPQGVDAFSPAPRMTGSEMVDTFSVRPDGKDIAKAPTPSVESPPSTKGRPSGLAENDGSTNRVPTQTKQSNVPSINAGNRDTRPDDVDKNFNVKP